MGKLEFGPPDLAGGITTMAKDWRTAYFEQARSDYEMFQLLLAIERVAVCHRLHYLQMATEKLAKGFQTPAGGPQHEPTHKAFETFLRTAKGTPRIRQACRAKNVKQFAAYIDSLLPFASLIERLAPALTNGPNPEYPWEASGTAVTPAGYSFPELDLKGPQMVKMLTFLESCFSIV